MMGCSNRTDVKIEKPFKNIKLGMSIDELWEECNKAEYICSDESDSPTIITRSEYEGKVKFDESDLNGGDYFFDFKEGRLQKCTWQVGYGAPTKYTVISQGYIMDKLVTKQIKYLTELLGEPKTIDRSDNTEAYCEWNLEDGSKLLYKYKLMPGTYITIDWEAEDCKDASF